MIPPFFLCLILVFFSEHQLFAEVPTDFIESTFQSLGSSELHVATEEETLNTHTKTQTLRAWGLTWRPTLEQTVDESSCTPLHFREALALSPSTNQVVKDFWRRCEPYWRLNTFNSITHSQSILRMDFEPFQHPAVRLIHWNIKPNLKVPGWLFFKGPTKRPLVVLRTGIFSTFDSTVAERFLMMQLFEEGPYHVLVLPSTTGQAYIELNQHFSFGGFEEGLQTSQILDLLADNRQPLNRYISKVHLVGISLGGHGVWLTNLLQQIQKKTFVDQTLLLCPAVYLDGIYQSQNRQFLTEFLLQKWFTARLSPLAKTHGLPDENALAEFLHQHFNHKQRPRTPWPLTEHLPPSPSQSLWEWNNFWSWLPPYDFEKTSVIWTRLDPVVPPALNAHLLSKLQGAPTTKLMELARGLHCSIPTTYQWAPVSLTVRGQLDAEMLSPPGVARQTIFSLERKVKNLHLRHVRRDGEDLQLLLEASFQNPLRPPRPLVMTVPSSLSDQNWVLSRWNDELEESLRREFQSRLDWEQHDSNLIIKILPRAL